MRPTTIKALSVVCALSFVLALRSPAQNLSTWVKKGDESDVKLEAAEALRDYLMAEKLDPKNAHVLTAISRQYRHLMSDASSSEEKMRLGGVALSYAQRASAAGPNDSDAQLALAITYARLVPLLGKGDQVECSRKIKESADQALRVNPNNGLAWYVLGRWHQVLADVSGLKKALGGLLYGSLPPATNDDAVTCFKKAIHLNPDRLMNYIELGRTYAQMKRNPEARQMINKGLAMPSKEKDDPECKTRGRETLNTLQ